MLVATSRFRPERVQVLVSPVIGKVRPSTHKHIVFGPKLKPNRCRPRTSAPNNDSASTLAPPSTPKLRWQNVSKIRLTRLIRPKIRAGVAEPATRRNQNHVSAQLQSKTDHFPRGFW